MDNNIIKFTIPIARTPGKPVIVSTNHDQSSWLFMEPLSLYSYGKHLTVVYVDNDGQVDFKEFKWPWQVAIGARMVDESSSVW